MANSSMKIAPFKVDVTPPLGHPIAYGVNHKVDSPIFVRGVVLDDGRTRAALAAADFIGIAGQAHREWTRTIARAARAPENQVLLHAVHQHDSLFFHPEAERLALAQGFQGGNWPKFWKDITARLGTAITAAVRPGRWQTVTSLATAERRVSGLGANRRLLDANGKVWTTRWSMTSDPKIQRLPVGLIDPIFRTIAFLGRGKKILAALHFYASHPQVAYHRNMVGPDAPGAALRIVEKKFPNAGLEAYFTGCGGDVTFGKYTTSEKEKNIAKLGGRLAKAMLANLEALEERPLGPIALARARFEIPFDPKVTGAQLERDLKKAKDLAQAVRAARRFLLHKNHRALGRPWVRRLSIGPEVNLLSLPSEVVVAYQLYAQELVPDRFLATTALGDYSYFYIPTARMYQEGGYEPGKGIYTPAIEDGLKKAIAAVLKTLR